MHSSIDRYFEIIKPNRFTKKYINFLFRNIPFRNKKVIDIGSGSGKYGIFAAINGAQKVVCLEPNLDGASDTISEKFWEYKNKLHLTNIELHSLTFQQYSDTSNDFDLILLHNSINHLDEFACINIQNDPRAKSVYQELAKKIFLLSSHNAKLIISDCTSSNFFAFLHLNNPFAPGIEWNKHQPPEIWIQIFLNAGFGNPTVHWTTSAIFGDSILGRIGRRIFDNKIISYFSLGHYCIYMEKP